MDVRARDIATWAREQIKYLASEMGSNVDVYRALKRDHGISCHWTQKFFCGQRSNPTQNQLDHLADALKVLLAKYQQAA